MARKSAPSLNGLAPPPIPTLLAMVLAAAISGCNADGSSLALADPASSLPLTGNNWAQNLPSINPDTVVGDSCATRNDPNHICLGLKYVAYAVPEDNDPATVTERQALEDVQSVNRLWRQCDVAFEISEFDTVDPTEDGLPYDIASYGDLESIRQDFEVANALLVVTTGKWDRSGSLGETSANAWTALPGGAPYGAVLEQPVATFSNIIAHELGHYLNLSHVPDATDLMNPIIYATSSNLTAGQCRTARSAATYFWWRMLR